jgi:hypothetical protein
MMDGDLRVSFVIAQRTGRTLHELYNGGPTKEPMTVAEFVQWRALLTIIEPDEAKKAQKK